MEPFESTEEMPDISSPCEWMNDMVAFPPDSPYLGLDDSSTVHFPDSFALEGALQADDATGSSEQSSSFERMSNQRTEPTLRDGGSDKAETPEHAPGTSPEGTGKSQKSSPKEKKHARLPKHALKVLSAWCDAHLDHPYPTEEEKRELESQTGLSGKQISNWMANARRRKIRPKQQMMAAEAPGWNAMTPMDRWRNSPPEAEAAPVAAIARAVASSAPQPLLPEFFPFSYYSPSQTSQLSYSPSAFASSVSSSSAPSSDGSSSSAASNYSTGSFNRFHSSIRHRRRRTRKMASTLNAKKERDSGERAFQCTFCTDAFKTRYDWVRHEKTLHLSLEKWTCTPFGPTYYDEKRCKAQCAFCGIDDPPEGHAETHRAHDCSEKPLGARTFYRKDHLVQHLRLVHGVSKVIHSMQHWKSDINRVASRCGFCNERFTTWSDRNQHLADHFKSGAQMKDWKGCRGLDPVFAVMVENAMPPYLIGSESLGMNPFSATRLCERGGAGSYIDHCRSDAEHCHEDVQPTPFAILTAKLGGFVKRAQQTGTAVTDEMLQQEARHIVYGDDDPWNQTAADNKQWLSLFKLGHGLLSDADMVDSICSDQLLHIQQCAGVLNMAWPDEALMPVLSTDFDPVTMLETYLQPPGMCEVEPLPGMDVSRQKRIQWALQNPECLAEYMARCRATQSAGSPLSACSVPPR